MFYPLLRKKFFVLRDFSAKNKKNPPPRRRFAAKNGKIREENDTDGGKKLSAARVGDIYKVEMYELFPARPPLLYLYFTPRKLNER